MDELTEAELLALIDRARGGDAAALNDLTGVVREYIRHLNAAHTGAMEPSELAQEATLNVWAYLNTFAGHTAAEFKAWIAIVSRSAVASRMRYLKRRKRDVQPASLPEDSAGGVNVAGSEPTASEVARHREQVDLAQQALNSLTAEDRMIFRLRVEDDLSWDEVAAETGLTADVAKKRHRRAILKLSAQRREQP